LETTITSTFARSFSTSQKAAALYLGIDGEVLPQKLNYRNDHIKENTICLNSKVRYDFGRNSQLVKVHPKMKKGLNPHA
jgi:hypothetical protein